MKSRDWFIVGVRLLGVWVLMEAIADIQTVMDIRFGYFVPLRTSTTSYYMVAARHIAIGSFLLFGAHMLAALVYPKPPAEESESPTTPTA